MIIIEANQRKRVPLLMIIREAATSSGSRSAVKALKAIWILQVTHMLSLFAVTKSSNSSPIYKSVLSGPSESTFQGGDLDGCSRLRNRCIDANPHVCARLTHLLIIIEPFTILELHVTEDRARIGGFTRPFSPLHLCQRVIMLTHPEMPTGSKSINSRPRHSTTKRLEKEPE